MSALTDAAAHLAKARASSDATKAISWAARLLEAAEGVSM